MRVKSLSDLGNINPNTPQAKRLREELKAYERDSKAGTRSPGGAPGRSRNPSSERGVEREPQDIRSAMILADSMRSQWTWVEDFAGPMPGRKFEIDLAVPEARLGVEVDGWQYHGKRMESFLRDRHKDYQLTLHGWVIVRVQAGLISTNPAEALDWVRRFMAAWVPRQQLIQSMHHSGDGQPRPQAATADKLARSL